MRRTIDCAIRRSARVILASRLAAMASPYGASASRSTRVIAAENSPCTETRSDQLPNIPTLGEFLPGFEASAFVAIGAPNNTPTEIIGRLNHEINAGLADPKIKARFAELGGTAFVGSPSEFSKLIADETEKWAKVIRTANIKPE